MNKPKNVVLIGMPGSGKSTVGVVLAKRLSYDFVDTDVLIQVDNQRSCQDIVDSDGHIALRKIEEVTLLKLDVQNTVISTGGSAVYSEEGMTHLKSLSFCIFLDASLETLEKRITNFATRGIAKRVDQSFADVYAERFQLYTRYADMTIKSDDKSVEQVCEEIALALTF